MTDRIKHIILSEKAALISIGIGLIIFLISIFLFLYKGSWNYSSEYDIDEAKIGQYGDFIGGIIGSLFSLVGVILFYVALKDQRKDFATSQKTLKVQLDAFQQQVREFELQREELAQTRKVYEEQSKTLKAQKFEETFYSFMNVFIEKRKSLAEGDYNDFFRIKISEFEIQDLQSGHEGLMQIKKAYENLYVENRSQLSSYFIIFYRLLKMIEMSDIQDKEIYHKILRSIISKDELLLLYYNYHSRFGKKPLPIVLKYEYFKHLEKLSKLEMQPLLKREDQIFILNSLVDNLSENIVDCIHKAKNLEEDEVVVEFEISEGAYIRIEVLNDLHLQLITDINNNVLFQRSINEFTLLLEKLLIDIIYSSYFVVFNEEYLQRVTTNDRNQIIESFRFNNVNHI